MSETFETQCRQLQVRIARSRRHVERDVQRVIAPWHQVASLGARHGRGMLGWVLAALGGSYLLSRWLQRDAAPSREPPKGSRIARWAVLARWLRITLQRAAWKRRREAACDE